MSGFTDELAEFVRDIWPVEPLADPLLESRARFLLLDTLGCAISGLASPQTRSLAETISTVDGGSLRLPGLERELSVHGFLTAFGASACTFEAPEGLASAQGRPGLHAVPAALAHAQEETSLAALLGAITIGYEVGGRIGQACRIRPGMHVDGSWGTFGAVAAIARLKGATPDVATTALEIAACQIPLSLYHPITTGSNARNLYVGQATALAGTAVLAAFAGITRPRGAIEEHIRLAMNGDATPLGHWNPSDDWLLMRGYLKKYPIVRHAHYGVEAALQWRSKGGRLRDAERIRLTTYANAMTYCGVRAPQSAIQAQFSMSWGLAWALVHGSLGIEAFLPAAFNDPQVRELEARIEIVEDVELSRRDARGATLRIDGDDTPAIEVSVSRLPGDPDNPLSRQDVENKFVQSTLPVIGEAAARGLVAAILDAPGDAAFTLR